MSASDPRDLALAFVALNEHLKASGDRASAVQRSVELAVSAVPGCDWAAISLWPRYQPPSSLATSDAVAATLDALQYDLGDGPCVTAALTGETVQAPDLAETDRWSEFCRAAMSSTQVRGVVAIPLAGDHRSATLNLYSGSANSFNAAALARAGLFAAHVRVLLIHLSCTEQTMQLTQALTTSRQIGAAVGVLMAVHKVTADEAFELLRTASQNLNRKLSLIAEDVTLTGALPEQRDLER
ncbi:MAG TPA: GAF and ANTAR domain-containing protein [Microlunatus sp.]|nr:GAF and ANTAR domain-containing protein [Microlunatus sp.]